MECSDEMKLKLKIASLRQSGQRYKTSMVLYLHYDKNASRCMIADPPELGPSFQYHAPSQGRSATHARRLYVSRIAHFRVSDPIHGAANTDVSSRHCAKDGAFGGNPAPTLGAYTAYHDTELERCPRMDKCPCSQDLKHDVSD